MSAIRNDFTLSLRGLRRSPGFAAVSILALAAGIGPNTAIFSIVNALLLRPLPFPEPERLVILYERTPQGADNGVAGAAYLDWRQQSTSFAATTATAGANMTLAGADRRLRVPVLQASHGFMEVFRMAPAIGRAFTQAEDQPAAPPVALLSYGAWERFFGGDPAIVGRTIVLDDRSFTLIGVLPPEFRYVRPFEVLVPLALDRAAPRDYHYLTVIARLKPAVSAAQARAEIVGVAASLSLQYPAMKKGWSANLYGLQHRLVRGPRADLPVLSGAALFVLVIACANVASLLLARATARRHEMAVRAALGAGRSALVRQLLMESGLLALAGGVAGIALAYPILTLLQRSIPTEALPLGTVFSIDARVLAFTFALSLLTALLFGLVPAWRASGVGLSEELKQGGRGFTGGGARLRQALVVAEFALAMVLITGAGLMVRSVLHIQTMDPGFDTGNVLTMRLELPGARYQAAAQMLAFMRQAEERVLALPGVRAAAFSTQLPMRGWGLGMPFEVVGKPAAEAAQLPSAHFQIISPAYFSTLGIPLLEGRFFTPADLPGAPKVAIVNDVFVRRYLGATPALGQLVRVQELVPGRRQLGHWVDWEIAGVIKAVGVGDPDSFSPEIYVPYAQSPFPAGYISVRTSNDTAVLASSVQPAIDAVDPAVLLTEIRTMEQLRQGSFRIPKLLSVLLGGFGALALGLSLMGIYGVMSWVVSQRAREIGIRMTLGAAPRAIMRQFLHQGLVLAGLGLAVGLTGALALTRVLRRMFLGITPEHPATILLVTLAMVAVAASACYFPARRALRVDPVATLRDASA